MKRLVLPDTLPRVPLPRVLSLVLVGALLGAVALVPSTCRSPQVASTAGANAMLERQRGCFVANLGQWDSRVRFVHRRGPMTLFLEDRGWTLDLVGRPTGSDERVRGVALRMRFEGDVRVPRITGEARLPGRHDYFLGNDASRWRTGVPRYRSVRYAGLYPGIDLRVRELDGVPEYDLLLEPGADLSLVRVHVEGADRLSLAPDGSLRMETALGPVAQSQPGTWQVSADGERHEVACRFVLLGPDRFGFEAPAWDGDASLTIDPALIYSTFLGGSAVDIAKAVSAGANGVLTVGGSTRSSSFPKTTGAYDTTYNGGEDAFVSRLDPGRSGAAQLVHATFLGGSSDDSVLALSAGAGGVVDITGYTGSKAFPTTSGAYQTTFQGPFHTFVSRLDPGRSGTAQLVYSTFLGGSSDFAYLLEADASGVVTVAGETSSSAFPTTSGAYDTTYNGGGDAFVSRLDPARSGSAQLVYSTFLGGSSYDAAFALDVDAGGVVTAGGFTDSNTFPVTGGAYDTTYNGGGDAFVSRLDPGKTGNAQLVYSTFLGGSSRSTAEAVVTDASGVVTVAGYTSSANFPTTSGAYDGTLNGGFFGDAFVSRLDPGRSGSAQLVYSTFLGGRGNDYAYALSADAGGVVTVAGRTDSSNFPATGGAHDTTQNGRADAFVSRLDPGRSGAAQLVYSTFLGGSGSEFAAGLSADGSGAVTVAGYTGSSTFPTTGGAYDTTYNGSTDVFVSRLSMGVAFHADRHEISVKQGGIQTMSLDAGSRHAGRSYWVLGSVSGTMPGITLLGLHFPLNPDPYTDLTLGLANTGPFLGFRGKLDNNGQATARLKVPSNLPALPGTVTLHHAYLVYDTRNVWYMVSNPVPLAITN